MSEFQILTKVNPKAKLSIISNLASNPQNNSEFEIDNSHILDSIFGDWWNRQKYNLTLDTPKDTQNHFLIIFDFQTQILQNYKVCLKPILRNSIIKKIGLIWSGGAKQNLCHLKKWATYSLQL